jgi:hypothetical protein
VIEALLGRVAGVTRTYIEDCFNVYTYTGTGASLTITDNIDRTKGALDIFKGRSGATDWAVYSTTRGVQKDLAYNTTAAETTEAQGVTATSSTGVTIGTLAKINTSSATYVKTTFRNAPNFFKETTVTKTGGSNATVDLSTLGTVGMVKVKRTDSTGSWYVWPRSLTAGKLLIGETTAAETTLGHITVSGTTLTLVDGVIADGTYHIEAYAHDTSADGLIQCGSFTTDGSGNATVTRGWEPQYSILKRINATQNWKTFDTMRGWSMSSWAQLQPDVSDAESSFDSATYPNGMIPKATGFSTSGFLFSSSTYIYVAVRRGPMRLPTSGTQVYQAIARTGTGATASVTGVGFPPDLELAQGRSGQPCVVYDRLRGSNALLRTALTNAEYTSDATNLKSFDMDGVSYGADASLGYLNASGVNYINHFFRRYPGVFDIICPRGTGVAHDEPHNLTVAPKLILWKRRNLSGDWGLYANFDVTTFFAALQWGSTIKDIAATYSGSYGLGGKPTATHIPLDATSQTNANGSDYEGLLFGELAGVSKIGEITGTGAIQVIPCGFAAGARFVLGMLTSGSGATSVYLWDSVRGIVSGNDPFLLLNSTAVENTSTDYVDPHASGFELPAGSPLNGVGTTAVFFAIA